MVDIVGLGVGCCRSRRCQPSPQSASPPGRGRDRQHLSVVVVASMSITEKRFEPGAGCPLDGIRVIDMSRLVSGNMVSLQLADFGAEVIKIEDRREARMRVATSWRSRRKPPDRVFTALSLFLTHSGAGEPMRCPRPRRCGCIREARGRGRRRSHSPAAAAGPGLRRERRGPQPGAADAGIDQIALDYRGADSGGFPRSADYATDGCVQIQASPIGSAE